MTTLIQWFTGEGQAVPAVDDDAEAQFLAESRDALPAHVQEFLELKASAGF